MKVPKILITAGEPAGIGPEILVKLAQENLPAQLIACANGDLLVDCAKQLELPLQLTPYDGTHIPQLHQQGHLWLIDSPLAEPVVTGQLNAANSDYVLSTLEVAAKMAMEKSVDAIVTGPVHKGIINLAGLPFTGHTEFFAEKAGIEKVVMMLATEGLRVALVTTHLPLSQVSSAITEDALRKTLTILDTEMRSKFAIDKPKIMVLGLNPHAGEDGHLGREELDLIIPTLTQLQKELGSELIGPIPADTGFKPNMIAQVDCVLAMYHDQGLPVLKHKGFGNAINITLGLPFIRTSVDHGTGLDIAGKNQADIGSMRYALNCTLDLIRAKQSYE